MRGKMAGFSYAIAAAAILAIAACAQTDAGITTKVKAKLAADDVVKAYQIDVNTKDKVVTLTGTVDSQTAKEQAVFLARGTEGVADVLDNITVSGPPGEPMPGGAMEPGMTGTPGMTESPGMVTTPAPR